MKIETIYDLIKRCIESCENDDQLSICSEMIDTFIIDRFPESQRKELCAELLDRIEDRKGTFNKIL